MKNKDYRLAILSKSLSSKNSLIDGLIYRYWRNAEFFIKSKGYRLGFCPKSFPLKIQYFMS